MRVRLTSEPDGTVALEAAYRDWEPVRDQFKLAIPWDGRQWDASRKRWIIAALYAADLLDFLRQVGAQVQDEREIGVDGVGRPPMPEDLAWAYRVLFLIPEAPLCVGEASFRALSKAWHPDKGGNAEDFHALGEAIAIVRRYLDPKEEPESDDHLPF